jgi:hypothetical protein
MNAIPSESAGRLGPPADTMSALHMLLLVVGVLLPAGGAGIFAASGPPLLGLALIVAGVALIIFSAAGLGKRLRPSSQPVSGTPATSASPVLLEGNLDPMLSRWVWLVKWLLAIPHYIVLSILWIAFLVVSVAAWWVILFTGRYPASLFQFAVGVLRWNWRVAFYAYGVLGTDRYPPFTLARVDYPATFEVEYPEKLSHWKVLFKSWLFALPHLVIIAALTGGVWATSSGRAANGISLLGVLVFIAAVILLFSGRYRFGPFNLIMGIQRWIYRTTAYAALLRDDYPPFRLDQGALEPLTRPTES